MKIVTGISFKGSVLSRTMAWLGHVISVAIVSNVPGCLVELTAEPDLFHWKMTWSARNMDLVEIISPLGTLYKLALAGKDLVAGLNVAKRYGSFPRLSAINSTFSTLICGHDPDGEVKKVSSRSILILIQRRSGIFCVTYFEFDRTAHLISVKEVHFIGNGSTGEFFVVAPLDVGPFLGHKILSTEACNVLTSSGVPDTEISVGAHRRSTPCHGVRSEGRKSHLSDILSKVTQFLSWS